MKEQTTYRPGACCRQFEACNLQLKKENSTVSIEPAALNNSRTKPSTAPQTSGPEKAIINPSNPSFTGKGGGYHKRAIRACLFVVFNN